MLSFIPPCPADAPAEVEAAKNQQVRGSNNHPSPPNVTAIAIGKGLSCFLLGAVAFTASVLSGAEAIASTPSDRNPIYIATHTEN